MSSCKTLLDALRAGGHDQALAALYALDGGQDSLCRARDRACHVVQSFLEAFSPAEDAPAALFSGPGRTEIGGNHTDHQHGRVLCGSVDLDMLACAAPNGKPVIRIQSEGYPALEISLDDLRPRKEEENTSAALVRGVRDFRADSGIAALLLDQLSPAAWPGTKAVLERETGLPVAGFLPSLPDCALESRHLGLVAPEELPGFREKARRLAAALVEHTDLELLQGIARSAPPLAYRPPAPPRPLERPVRVAVARDAAFSFYYQDSLELLERAGAELVPFSPLAGDPLPPGAAGLLLGGGYPELHARELSQNRSTREQLGQAILGGLPTVAECGGFLYLQETLEDGRGGVWPMVGVLPGDGYKTDRLQRFGYKSLAAQADSLLFRAGESIPVHEFHYWDCTRPGPVLGDTMYAGFPHLHFGGALPLAERFVEGSVRWRKQHE